MIVILLLCLAAIIGGIVAGFLRGRVALGFILSVGVPSVLVLPLAAYRRLMSDNPKKE